MSWMVAGPALSEPWRELPAEVADLLAAAGAAGRLVAHLRLVHDVAWELTGGLAVWEAFVSLDDCLQRLAEGADERLAFQNAFPVGGKAGWADADRGRL